MGNLKSVVDQYRQLYSDEPLLFKSPGRINLMGEHTDYNLGQVLPAPINKYIYFAIGLRSDDTINIDSADFSDKISSSLSSLEPAWKLWPNYILGVIDEFKKANKHLSGINIVFGGDIPLSAGMSSSAAICSGMAFALNKIFKAGYSSLELAKIAMAAEHNYLKVKCGIMDQFANLFGKAGNLVRLDCNTLEHSYIPFSTESIKIVLFDTGVKHNFIKLSAAFQTLQQQCKTGLEMVKQHVPYVTILPDVTEQMLNEYVKPFDDLAYKRCLYIVQETKRIEKFCEDIKRNDLVSAGQHFFANHTGLKELYEVTCDETDFLVDTAKDIPHVFGARMMGAGFGGCTINLIQLEGHEETVEQIKALYKQRFQRELKVYYAEIGNCTEEIRVASEQTSV